MNLNAFLYLLRLSLRNNVKRHLGVFLGIGIGAFALALSALATVGVVGALEKHLKKIVPQHRVMLKPVSLNLAWLQVQTSSISTYTLQAVREIPGVLRVSPEAVLRIPAKARGQIFNTELVTDVSLSGVE